VPEGYESVRAAGTGKGFGIAEWAVLSESDERAVDLLGLLQVARLKGATKLLNVCAAILIEVLELLKKRIRDRLCGHSLSPGMSG